MGKVDAKKSPGTCDTWDKCAGMGETRQEEVRQLQEIECMKSDVMTSLDNIVNRATFLNRKE